MLDSAMRTVGRDGITVDIVRGIQAGIDTLQSVINGAMTLDEAQSYVYEFENDSLPGIMMTRRIINRAVDATKKDAAI